MLTDLLVCLGSSTFTVLTAWPPSLFSVFGLELSFWTAAVAVPPDLVDFRSAAASGSPRPAAWLGASSSVGALSTVLRVARLGPVSDRLVTDDANMPPAASTNAETSLFRVVLVSPVRLTILPFGASSPIRLATDAGAGVLSPLSAAFVVGVAASLLLRVILPSRGLLLAGPSAAAGKLRAAR